MFMLVIESRIFRAVFMKHNTIVVPVKHFIRTMLFT